MKRREFFKLAGGAAVWPLAARAQQAMPVIGFLSSRSPGESAHLVTAFRGGLTESGFVEGQNMVIAFRWAEGHYDRLPSLAIDLVNSRVAVIVTAGVGSHVGDPNDSDCLHCDDRPGPTRFGREPKSAGGQRDRNGLI